VPVVLVFNGLLDPEHFMPAAVVVLHITALVVLEVLVVADEEMMEA
jgi:hypothetical protein